jgi:type IV secretory pathway VirB10-like protein
MDLKLVSRTLILAVAGGAFSLSALAQWQWIDKDGRKVYSDRSPPSDIPEKNILKMPRGAKGKSGMVPVPEETVAAPAAAASTPVAKADPNAPKLTGKDAQLEAKKKQAEDEAAAKKQAEEEKVAKAKADNCDRAKKSLAGLQSGQRIPSPNANGERDYMDDNARAAEIKRTQGIVSSDCK